MEEQPIKSTNQGAVIETEKNLPHGLVEPVLVRGSQADNSSTIATQTVLDLTKRAKYGEDPAFEIKSHTDDDPTINVNLENKEQGEITVKDYIIQNQYSSMSRHSSQ